MASLNNTTQRTRTVFERTNPLTMSRGIGGTSPANSNTQLNTTDDYTELVGLRVQPITGGATRRVVSISEPETDIEDTNPHAKGMTSPETQMLGNVIGAGADIAGDVIGGLITKGQRSAAQKEARAMDEQSRKDRLVQADEEFSINRRKFVNEKEQLEINNKIKAFDSDYDNFINSIKRVYTNKKNFLDSVKTMFNPVGALNTQVAMINPKLGVK